MKTKHHLKENLFFTRQSRSARFRLALTNPKLAMVMQTSLEFMSPFVPTLGVWVKPLKISMELKDPFSQDPPSETPTSRGIARPISDIFPPELKENGQLLFSWATKMDPKTEISIALLHQLTWR